MAADSTYRKDSAMKDRMIGIIATVDHKGVYTIDDEGAYNKLPWGTPLGRTLLARDAERFAAVTKKTVPEGKTNVVITDHGTAKSMGMYPFRGRRMIVLAPHLNLDRINKDRSDDARIFTARSLDGALRLALSWKDCGHVFFTGALGVWSDALNAGICNCAFITVVKFDSVMVTPFSGKALFAACLLKDETFIGMRRDDSATVSVADAWEDISVELEFRNYHKT